MSNAWHKIDSVLNESGEWLLVGSISCATLPPLVGIIGCMTLLIAAANKSDRKVEKWERNLLKTRIDSGNSTKKEEHAFIKLNNKLERTKKSRKTSNFTIGYISIWLTFGYLSVKDYFICHEQVLTINGKLIIFPDWLIKGFWGSL